ncbi:MAG: tetratricopeptide repeat protein [Planctomycetia bacterium]|nr:tetratricopeptide repeat protein [Planctomycetia bacterium]
MKAIARWLAGCFLVLTVTVLDAAEPTAADIAKAVKQLGDDNFQAREQASLFLRAAGRKAEAALIEAAKSPDREVSRRAGEILEDFKWGIYPDTPKDILTLINRYKNGADDDKLVVCKELAKQGPAGFVTLLKISSAEENIPLRRNIYEQLSRDVVTGAGDLLLDGNLETLERFLELGLASEREPAARHYAAHLLFAGKLDGKVVEYRAKADKGDKAAAEVLYFLARAQGRDAKLQRWAAEQSGSAKLLCAALLELGDWQELARRYTKEPDADEFGIEKLTLNIGYLRAAGKQPELKRELDELRKFTTANFDDPGYVWLGAKALFLNDRPDEALDLLIRGKQYHPAFEILCFQARFAEAMALAERVNEALPEQRPAVLLGKARVLAQLGERDQAVAVLKGLPEKLDGRSEYPTMTDLIQQQLRMGLKDQAFALAAERLKDLQGESILSQYLSTLFPNRGGAALGWWKVLRRRYVADETAAMLSKLRSLVDGKPDAKERAEWIDRAAKVLEEPGAEKDAGLLADLAEAFAVVGERAREEKCLELAIAAGPTAATLQRLGDRLAEKKAWEQAAQRYRQAWEKDKGQPLPLYLQGWSLTQAGREVEGKKLIETAHWLVLGGEYITRYHFARTLGERGQLDAARRERDLLFRVGALEGWGTNEAIRHLAYDAQHRKDYGKAAELFEKFRLRCLRTSVQFVEQTAHVQVPLMLHQNAARAALQAGKLDEARREIELCLKLSPANVNLPIQLVADLEKAERKPEADELFGQVFALHDKVCKEYPRSAASHNTLAWLAACCRRELPKAQEAAERAVQLSPDSAGYIDTLAEVHFQRGNKDKAVELMKRCLELEPKNEYFRQQLKRVEAGDPKAPLPEEVE